MFGFLRQMLFLSALLLQLLPATAFSATGHTSLRAGARKAVASSKEQQKLEARRGEGDDADDDDDDGDDADEGSEAGTEIAVSPEAAEASAPEASTTMPASATVAPVVKSDLETLEAEAARTHQQLVDNLAAQVKVTTELTNLTDEEASKAEIDSNVKIVANETYSPALADFLGDMWTEMRTFSKPMYEEHLQETLTELRMEQGELELTYNKSLDALSAYKSEHSFEVAYTPEPTSAEVVVSNPVQLAAAATNATVANSNSSSTEEGDHDDDDDDEDDDDDDLSAKAAPADTAAPVATKQ